MMLGSPRQLQRKCSPVKGKQANRWHGLKWSLGMRLSFLLLTPLPLSLPPSLSPTHALSHTQLPVVLSQESTGVQLMSCVVAVTLQQVHSVHLYSFVSIHRVDWYAVYDYNYDYYSIRPL